MRLARALLFVPVLTVVLAGCGGHSSSATQPTASRTVDVTMVDNAFAPATVNVTRGETVKFRFKNTGAMRHEGVIGDDAEQDHHREDMAASGGSAKAQDEHHGDGPQTAVTVEPGQTGELTHTFANGGTILIGCHEPGHWEAGMKATVTVA